MTSVSDAAHVGGEFEAQIWRDTPEGPKCIQQVKTKNTMLTSGLKELWRFLVGGVAKEFDQGRIGTCGAAASSAQTNLLSPYAGTLTTVDVMTFTGTRTMEWKWSYPSGVASVSGNIKELAILSQVTSPGGTALARGVLSPSAQKTEDDKLILYYRNRAS